MAQIITSLDPVTTIGIDEVDASTTYIGIAKAGTATSAARWQIRRIIVDGTVTRIDFADSNDRYDNVWDNRLTLTYG